MFSIIYLKLIEMFISISLSLIIILCVLNSSSPARITSRCGKPGLPPQSKLIHRSYEMKRFDNNETVYYKCPDHEIPHLRQSKKCVNGRWIGKQAKCGKTLEAQVVNVEILDCTNKVRLFYFPFNQSSESLYETIPRNSFHYTRLPNISKIFANYSNCYIWKFSLDEEVQVAHMIIDFYFPEGFNKHKMENELKSNKTHDEGLKLNMDDYQISPIVPHRTCIQVGVSKQDLSTIGWYFDCSLDLNKENVNPDQDKTKDISVRFNATSLTFIELEALILGGIYTKDVSGNKYKLIKPDCGELEIQTVGTDVRKENAVYYVQCNDSFTDFNSTNRKEYKFECNANGEWTGEWPTCVPILSCPGWSELTEEIEKDKSVAIEEIGNAFYVKGNDSFWFSINDTWIKYVCLKDDYVMVGREIRKCEKNGSWSGRVPFCTSTGISGFTIIAILVVVLATFSGIIFVLLRRYSRRVKEDLRQTKSEIQQSTARMKYSHDSYVDTTFADTYDLPDNTIEPDGVMRSNFSPGLYEDVRFDFYSGSETPRYEVLLPPRIVESDASNGNLNTEHGYLDMKEIRQIKHDSNLRNSAIYLNRIN